LNTNNNKIDLGSRDLLGMQFKYFFLSFLAFQLPSPRCDATNRNIGVWSTKSVVLCVAMGEMAVNTASTESRKHTSHVMNALIAQAFVFK